MTQHQQEAMALIGEITDLSAEIRLGQLFAHLGFLGEAHLGRGLGYIEDGELLNLLYHHRADLLARHEREPDKLISAMDRG